MKSWSKLTAEAGRIRKAKLLVGLYIWKINWLKTKIHVKFTVIMNYLETCMTNIEIKEYFIVIGEN